MTELIRVVGKDSFNEVTSSEKLVLVDFFAEWCRPCQAIMPIVENIASTYVDTAEVRKLDIDEDAEMAEQFNVRGIPTFLLFKGGEVVERVTGKVTASDITEILDRHSA